MSDDPDEDLRQTDQEINEDLQETIEESTGSNEETTSEENNENDSSSEEDTNSGDEGSTDEGSSDEGATEESEDEDEGEYDGVASAYKKDKKSKDSKVSGDKKFALPGRGNWAGVKKEGKLIGEVLYDELIAFIEWLMKGSVDLVLDFADYVLFKSYKSLQKNPPKEENEPKTVFDHGREIEKGYAEKASAGIGFYKKALKEVLDNIEKKKRGEAPEWTVFREEPRWFAEAVRLEQEATANPGSEAARKWERFKNSDKIIEGKLGNEAVYRIISTRLATFEEAMKGEKFKLPENIEKKMEEMEKILQKKNINAADLKSSMAEKINEMRTMVGSSGFVNLTIKAKLDEMQGVVSSSEEDVRNLKRDLKTPIQKIKEIDPIPEHIKTLSREDYEKITKNIDKIREKYKRDPHRKIEVMSAYVNGIITALNNTQENVIKYEKASRFSKSNAAEKTKKTIYGLINKAGDYINKDGEPIINLKTQKQKAEQGIASVKSAINDFEIEHIKISEYADAVRRSSTPSSDKSSMLRQMSSYFRSR